MSTPWYILNQMANLAPQAANPDLLNTNVPQRTSYSKATGDDGGDGSTGTKPPSSTTTPGTTTAKGELTFQMPDGTRVPYNASESDLTGHASQPLQDILAKGGRPLGPDGNPLTAVNTPYGGQLWQDSSGKAVPMNVLAGYNWGPGQQQLTNAFMQSQTTGGPPPLPGQQTVNWGMPGYKGPVAKGTPTGSDQFTGTPGTSYSGNWGSVPDLFGLGPEPNYITDINLQANPQISLGFDPAAMDLYNKQNATAVDYLGGIYNYTTPQMTAAQFGINPITGMPNTPQTQATLPKGNTALDFLLSGQGYTPDTLARMQSAGQDQISREQASQLGTAKIGLEQAGLAQSGALPAMEDQIARAAGAARTQAANQVAIENAQQAMQNLTTGAGMGIGLSENSAQQANQVALQNAANEFNAMQQNVMNQQAANQSNAQAQQQQRLSQAGAQSGLAGTIATNTAQAELAKQAQAEAQNTANTINWNLNNAQMQRQRQIVNSQIGENRYGQALGGMLSLSGASNPFGYYGTGANIGSGYTPNLFGAQSWSNLASGMQPNQRTTNTAGTSGYPA